MFIISKEEFIQAQTTWKAKKEHSAALHIIYNILRGNDPKSGFVVKSKNIQGNDPWYGYNLARRQAYNFCHPTYVVNFTNAFNINLPVSLQEILKNA